MKRIILITLTIAITLVSIFLLWVFGPALTFFGGSLALAAALRPLVQRLEARGLSRSLAILIWYLIILVALGMILFFYGLQLVTDIGEAAAALPRYYDTIRQAWQHGTALQQMISRGLPSDINGLLSGGGLAALGGTVVDIANATIGSIVFLVGVLSLAYYWLIEATHFERFWLSLLPVSLRVRARDVWRNTETAVGAYIRATVSAIMLAGLLLYLVYRLVGLPFLSNTALPFVTTLALVGGLSHLVPRLGPALGLIPAVLVALTISPIEAALVLALGGLIQILVHHIGDYLMRIASVKVNPLLQVLLLLALADLGGLQAMIFAPPLAALIKVLYANLLAVSTTQPQKSELDLLIERLQQIQRVAPEHSLELTSTLRRSNELFTQAQEMLREQ